MQTKPVKEPIKIPAKYQILLHLLPGLFSALVYAPTAYYFHSKGIPSILAFILVAALLLFPIQIALPIYLEKKKNTSISIKEIFLFREKIPAWQLILYAIGTVVWAALVFTVASSTLAEPIQNVLMKWLPDWFDIGYYARNFSDYAKPIQITVAVTSLILAGFIGPIVEEFYFRGYLLPRMSFPGVWAPIMSAILMSIYHFWSPWLILLRFIAIMPMIYLVWRKKNIYIGIASHCILNTISEIMGMILIFSN